MVESRAGRALEHGPRATHSPFSQAMKMGIAGALSLLLLPAVVLSQPWRTNDIMDVDAACQQISGNAPRRFADGNEGQIFASSESVNWGFFWKHSRPYAVANSGDEFYIEAVTHHGTDAYDEIVRGDPAMEDIYTWNETHMTLNVRGASGKSDGAHIMTGPVWICGAEKDDVLQIDLMELEPRRNPSTGKSFAVNAAAWWGFHRRTEEDSFGVDRKGGYRTGDNPRETITVYEALLDEGKDAQGNYFITPRYGFQWWTDPLSGEVAQANNGAGVGGDWEDPTNQTTGQDSTEWNGASRTYCVPEGGIEFQARDPAYNYTTPVNTERTYGKGVFYPCVNGYQSWNEMGYRGMNYWSLIDPNTDRIPKKTKYYIPELWGGSGTSENGMQNAFKMRGRMHPGNIGVARDVDNPTNSIPPGIWAGNMDNRRLTAGTTLYVPVQVAGALFSVGDCHFSQGDSEMDGTGAEGSVNLKLKFTLHKKDSLPAIVQELETPIIETPQEFIIQGGSIMNYHTFNYPEEEDWVFGAGRGSGGDLNGGLATTYRATRDWMMRVFDWGEDLTLSAITMGVDFGISQVVDGVWGVHAIIPKMFFPVEGHPAGPRDRTGELPRSSSTSNIVRLTVPDDGSLSDSDLQMGEASNTYRMAARGLIQSIKNSVSSCEDAKPCGLGIEVLSMTRTSDTATNGGKRRRMLAAQPGRELLQSDLTATLVVSGIPESDLQSALTSGDPMWDTGSVKVKDSATVMVTSDDGSNGTPGGDNSAGSVRTQLMSFVMLSATLLVCFA